LWLLRLHDDSAPFVSSSHLHKLLLLLLLLLLLHRAQVSHTVARSVT
jgi:hypothetical protein